MPSKTLIREKRRTKSRKRCEQVRLPGDTQPRDTKCSRGGDVEQPPIESTEEELWGSFRRLFKGTLDF